MEFKRALRGLKRSPGFAMGVILLLGIATAGLLTVSTAVYTLFFQPLPYHDAGQLVRLSTLMRAMGNVETGLSAPMLVELQQDPALTDIAAYQNAESVVDDSGMTWRRARLTHNLFDVFGVQPLLGRNFVAEDGAPGAALAALVSERVWRQRLVGQADVLERNISLEGKPVKIVGVLPDAVAIPSRSTELWLPLQFTPEQLSPSSILTFGREFDGVVARLAPGVTAKAFQDRLRARYMEDERLAQAIKFSGLEFRVKSLQESWTDKYRAPLSILSFAVAMLLLATVLNLAGMWVLRMLDRSHGQALQAALGASRWQNMASIITEYAVLGAAGVTLAVMLTPLGVSWLGALNILDANLPITVGVGPATVLLALAVLLLGALPVVVGAWWQARRQQFPAALQLASGGASARSGPGASLQMQCSQTKYPVMPMSKLHWSACVHCRELML
jgi:putative ABC transport system permease protein